MNQILDITLEEYYSQSTLDNPALSYSIAKLLVNKSPAHAYLEHPKFANVGHTSSSAMDEGSILHKLILGKGSDFSVLDFDDLRTKAARERAEEIRQEGKIPILEKKLVEMYPCAEAFKSQVKSMFEISNFYDTEDSEVPVIWDLDGIQWLSLFDRPVEDTIYDLKFTTSAKPHDIARKIIDMGYDIQSVAYTMALESVKPELQGRGKFVFLFQETEPPYCLTPVILDAAGRELGYHKVIMANEIWRDCLQTGIWPGYATGITTIETPAWALRGLNE